MFVFIRNDITFLWKACLIRNSSNRSRNPLVFRTTFLVVFVKLICPTFQIFDIQWNKFRRYALLRTSFPSRSPQRTDAFTILLFMTFSTSALEAVRFIYPLKATAWQVLARGRVSLGGPLRDTCHSGRNDPLPRRHVPKKTGVASSRPVAKCPHGWSSCFQTFIVNFVQNFLYFIESFTAL